MEFVDYFLSRRVAALTAVFLVVMFSGVSLSQLVGESPWSDVVLDVAGSPDDYEINIGFEEFVVSTLNPFAVTTSCEWALVWSCYSTLLMDDVDGKGYIGDLAVSWDVSPDGTLWSVQICDNAFFYDKRETVQDHQVTADDVMFSYWIVQNNTNNVLYGLLSDVSDVPSPLIVGMWSDGPFELCIQTSVPYAPFYRTMATIPIVPKYYWDGADPTDFFNDLLIGSGPFYYDGDGIPLIGVCTLDRNPIWFQTDLRGWQIHTGAVNFIDTLSSEAAYAALTADPPQIDVMLDVPRTTYLDIIPSEDPSKMLVRYAPSTGFLYEVALNQMTEGMRESLGGLYEYGDNNPLLLDPAVKQAIAMCVDKQTFIDTVLDGLGSVADSLVPDSNEWHYVYGSDPEDDPFAFDVSQARNALMGAGWSYDTAGDPATSTTVPLCRVGGTDPLEFRFITLNTEEEFVTGALLLRDSCALAGVKLNLETISLAMMATHWLTGDYDVMLWDWIFSPQGDPSADMLSVMTTMAIGWGSGTHYSNATFDGLYNDSIVEMSADARALIVDEMQRMVYEDASCQCVAYRPSLYAATERHWTGYGNWSENIMLLPDQGLPWLYMRISPVGNLAPVVAVDADFYGAVDIQVAVTAAMSDDSSPLEYKWFWGDGTCTDWVPGTSGAADHVYSDVGNYTAYVAAREDGGDGFITWNRTTILIDDEMNYPPYPDPAYEGTPITYEPDYPGAGDMILFTSHFVDDDGDDLFYSWDFDNDGVWEIEGSTETVAYHQYSVPGTYTVRLDVRDSDGRTNTTEVSIEVCEAIPEFSTVLVPVLSLMLLVAVVASSRRRRDTREKPD